MSLLVKRLRITAGRKVAYDAPFTAGINVIEGENSSGKSTLLKLLYHGLGGTIPGRQWSDAAKACDRVYVELAIGQATVTVSRKVVDSGLPPFIYFDGDMEAALSSSLEKWQEIPYSRSEDRQSYSQLMFMLLGMPEAFGEQGDFVTFNQFLRIHYADQDSANSTVLRSDDQFDKPSTREAIGSFVLGGTDQNLAKKERQLREAERLYSQALASVSAGNILLGSDYNELSLDGLGAAQDVVSAELLALQERALELRGRSLEPIRAGDIDQERIVTLTNRLAVGRADLSDRVSSRAELELEVNDSELFVRALEERVRYLTQAMQAADQIGQLSLEDCPVCGAEVEISTQADHCYLCKSHKPVEPPASRYLSLLNSTQSQLEQSKRVQRTRTSHLGDLDAQIEAARAEIREVADQIENQKLTVSTVVQAELAEIQGRIGFLQSERERLRRDIRVVERLNALRGDRDRLSTVINSLREEIEVGRNGGSLRLAASLSAVSAEAGEFLQADLDRQVEFHNDPHIEVDYRNNIFSIGGQRAFSASSTSYARNAIFLGTMFAANRSSVMRHLQFLMLENLEDKGMEPERYHRLHKTIVDKSADLRGSWQILIATADLNPEIRDSVHLVDRYYTHGRKTLDLP